MKNENENNEEVDNNGDESGKPSSEYVKELLKEKVSLDPDQHPNAMRLLDEGSLHCFRHCVAAWNSDQWCAYWFKLNETVTAAIKAKSKINYTSVRELLV